MGTDVRGGCETASRIFSLADEALGIPISQLCASGPDDELTNTMNAQPAILLTSLAILAAALESGAIASRPAYVAGHSLGHTRHWWRQARLASRTRCD